MNKLTYPVIGALILGVALPALAGPDFQLIEQARKAGQQTEARRAQDTAAKAGLRCPPQPLILPLDHGPRAQTTPYLNQLRKQRFEAAMKACKAQS